MTGFVVKLLEGVHNCLPVGVKEETNRQDGVSHLIFSAKSRAVPAIQTLYWVSNKNE
jgi:hypothetical protein